MQKNSRILWKVWGIPILLAMATIIGLLSAIMGVGIWHVMSWIALIVPIYVMVKYSLKFFE